MSELTNNIFTEKYRPSRLEDLILEGKDKLTESSEAVNIAGQWYYPIEKVDADTGLSQSLSPPQRQDWSKVVFYQNRKSFLVDMIYFAGRKNGEIYLAVRGYDYREVKSSAVLVPTKIEIFRANRKAVLLQRLVEVDLKQPLEADQPQR